MISLRRFITAKACSYTVQFLLIPAGTIVVFHGLEFPVLNESDNVTDRFVTSLDRGPYRPNAGGFTRRQDRLC